MFCKNCGIEIANNAAICVHCGVKAGTGNAFCGSCGQTVLVSDRYCMQCGVENRINSGKKDFITTIILAVFVGTFGVHRFYTGNIGIGVLQLLTLGGCGIWQIIDIILIATGDYRDGNGEKLDRTGY